MMVRRGDSYFEGKRVLLVESEQLGNRCFATTFPGTLIANERVQQLPAANSPTPTMPATKAITPHRQR
jgi:hypothetical protein